MGLFLILVFANGHKFKTNMDGNKRNEFVSFSSLFPFRYKGHAMLTVYSAKWCPHCVRTIEFLNEKNITHREVEIEKEPDGVVKKVIEVNGGEDWVIPTLEFQGKWRPGKVFDANILERDLKEMGVL